MGLPAGLKCSVFRGDGIVKLGKRWLRIGIRREEKNRWETRAPLIPSHAKDLRKLSDVEVVVQPCNKRIFTNQEYQDAGAKIEEDLTSCDVIVGVKEIPVSQVVPGKTHICFSHTHKGQPAGAPLLSIMINKKATLMDYELLTDDKGARILAFGKYAGYAGMINCLHGLGDRILQLGFRTPFLNLGLAHHYPSLAAAKKAVQLVAKEIEKHGLPSELGPLSFVFTGEGNVSTGAQEIFSLLPHKMVKPKDYVAAVKKSKGDILIGTVMTYDDFTATVDGRKVSKFAEEFAPHSSVLVNGIFWNQSLPRILSKHDMDSLQKRSINSLISIADISCDIDGGVEMTSRATTIDSPFMYYDAKAKKCHDGPRSKEDIQMMTIDNLPAQLPREASTHFSNTLVTLLKNMAKAKETPEVMQRATIVANGQLVDRFKHLSTTDSADQSILVLGSGYVSKPTIDYLAASTGKRIVVASNSLEDAKKVCKDVPKATPTLIDTKDQVKLEGLVKDSKVVISLLPAAMHPQVAELCIKHGKDMVTGSYISPQMKGLQQPCLSSGITVINEIGLDPGLDHLSAMKMIDEARSQGDKVESFASWCGGLPAPECADNPFGYKFSWRPQGVLLATQNPARYLLNGKTYNIEGKDLLRSAMPIKIHNAFAFEGIPNRDSLGYIEQYGLQGVHTMFRGTLRYRGFSELLDSCAKIGLLNTSPMNPLYTQKQSWADVIEALVPPTGGHLQERFARALGSSTLVGRAKRLIEALEWLGAMDKSKSFNASSPTMLDAFAGILEKSLVYKPGERDMAFMLHEIHVTSPTGKKAKLTSTLVEYGDPSGYSAMAKTVGVPVAVAAEMLLNGQIKEKGVIAPLSKAIYNPMLKTLEQQGIIFKETKSTLEQQGIPLKETKSAM